MIPHVTLNSRHRMPILGLGTWELTGKTCLKAVQMALDIGYRHIDTASMYGNHKEVGKAIKGFPREQLFITSKMVLEQVDDDKVSGSVRDACHTALKELGVEYLDLYLIHAPDRKRPMNEVFDEMTNLSHEGKLRDVGVSNFTIHHLQDMIDAGFSVAANQVEFHPYLYQRDLWEFCKKNRIQLISFRSLGKGVLTDEPVCTALGKKYGKTSSQVILRWLVQKDIPVIPKASTKAHLIENFSIFDFVLTNEEMKKIDDLNQDKRLCRVDFDEFDY